MKPLPFTKLKTFKHSVFTWPILCRANDIKAHTYRLNYREQQGDMLIEALVGLVLMAIIAIGVTTITSKVEKGKREMSVQDLAVSQLQELLVKNGNGSVNLCDSTPETITLPDETITVVASGCTPITSTVNGVSLTDLKQPIVLSATSAMNSAVFTVGGVSSQR
jgi:Tfp pilus assembly protein PilV